MCGCTFLFLLTAHEAFNKPIFLTGQGVNPVPVYDFLVNQLLLNIFNPQMENKIYFFSSFKRVVELF